MTLSDAVEIADRIAELEAFLATTGWKVFSEHMLALSEVETTIALRDLDGRAAGAQGAYMNAVLWPSREIARLRMALTNSQDFNKLTKE